VFVGFLAAGWLSTRPRPAAPFSSAAALGAGMFVLTCICNPAQRAAGDPTTSTCPKQNIRSFVIRALVFKRARLFSDRRADLHVPKVVGTSISETAMGSCTPCAWGIDRGLSHNDPLHRVAFFAGGRSGSRRSCSRAACCSGLHGLILRATWPGSCSMGLGAGIAYMMCAYYVLGHDPHQGPRRGPSGTLIGFGRSRVRCTGGSWQDGAAASASLLWGLVPLAITLVYVQRPVGKDLTP